jgi:tetratricopeptide (TPR) repeat protein
MQSRRSFMIGAVAYAASSLPLFAQGDFVAQWPDLTARIERAYLSDDMDQLRSIRAACLRALLGPLPPDKIPLVRYAVAYVDWRMVFNPSVGEKEKDAMLDEAQSQLEQAIKTDDKFAEAHALMAAIYGGKISRSSLRGITLGPRAGSALARAGKLEPDNPRVPLQDGIGAFNTPSMFGGGVDKAEKLLRRAIMLLEKEPVEKPWPNWGRFDAYAWLGQILVKKRDFTGARTEYEKALAIAPKSGWITYLLMPELEKAMKTKP